MQKFDVLIVGGGMVGLTLALAIRQQSQFTVAIADVTPLTALSDSPEIRVSAINAASEQIFQQLAVWPLIQAQRLQAYQHMHVWDKAGYGKLDFSLTDLPASEQNKELGHIIENKVIRTALWQKAQQDNGIRFFTDDALTGFGVADNDVFASFSKQMPITAKMLVGADGANSWVREQIKAPMAFRDYDHHAVVATVACSQGHQNTAWQVFLPSGPLAFLPLYNSQLCSIVWSTSPQEATRLLNLEQADFAKEITAASDGKLGSITLASERASYPLSMRLVHDFVKDRVVLIGDAAHTIHPLAGQGVNLGLLDATALAQTLCANVSPATEQQALVIDAKALKVFNRWRKSDATDMVAAMEAIKQVFTPQYGPAQLVRGIGLSLLDQLAPAKRLLMQQALGNKGKLPLLAQKVSVL